MYEVYHLYKVVNLQSEQWQVESTNIINNIFTCQPVLWIRRYVVNTNSYTTVFILWWNCCLEYTTAVVTVVPLRLSQQYHRSCHNCTMAMGRLWQPQWNKCDNRHCHNCSKVILSTLSSLTDKIVCQPSVSAYLTVY